MKKAQVAVRTLTLCDVLLYVGGWHWNRVRERETEVERERKRKKIDEWNHSGASP